MIKYIQILFLLPLLTCAQNVTNMETPENLKEKFAEFIVKKKFEKENYYSGVSNENLKSNLTEKVNQVALDFKSIAESNEPTDEKYIEKIRIGLSNFEEVYMDLDTEDRERVCTYFEELMDIVSLKSSNGQLNKFMYGFDPSDFTKKN